MINDKEVAKYIECLMRQISGEINESIIEIQEKCSPREFEEYRRAAGKVMGYIFLDIMNPIYKRHPEIMPDELKSNTDKTTENIDEITRLNKEFSNYLEGAKTQMITDIRKLLGYDDIRFLENKSKTDMVAFCFEYEYDYLNIVFYGMGKDGNAVTEPVILSGRKNSKVTEDSVWKSFMPESIWKAFSDFEDNHEGDDIEDMVERYEGGKYRLFENWFYRCWREAKKQIPVKIDAYFSIHDTIFKTDLNTLKTIKEKDILSRYKYDSK